VREVRRRCVDVGIPCPQRRGSKGEPHHRGDSSAELQHSMGSQGKRNRAYLMVRYRTARKSMKGLPQCRFSSREEGTPKVLLSNLT